MGLSRVFVGTVWLRCVCTCKFTSVSQDWYSPFSLPLTACRTLFSGQRISHNNPHPHSKKNDIKIARAISAKNQHVYFSETTSYTRKIVYIIEGQSCSRLDSFQYLLIIFISVIIRLLNIWSVITLSYVINKIL